MEPGYNTWDLWWSSFVRERFLRNCPKEEAQGRQWDDPTRRFSYARNAWAAVKHSFFPAWLAGAQMEKQK